MENNTPFREEFGEIVGEGKESIVRELGQDSVVKELKLDGEKRNINTENIIEEKRDYEKLKEIFKEQLQDTEYVIGEGTISSKPTLYKIQKRLRGSDLVNTWGKRDNEKEQFVKEHKEEFANLIWKTKKAFLVLGAPIDFNPRNIRVEEVTQNLILVDVGSPSRMASRLNQSNIREKALRRLYRIETYTNYLNLSDEEEQELNRKYDLDQEEYQEAIANLTKNEF